MTPFSSSHLRMPLIEGLIVVALTIVAVPLLLLPGCSSSSSYGSAVVRSLSQPLPNQQKSEENGAQVAPHASPAPPICPAINFQTTQQLIDNNTAEYFGLERQADGSFTQQVYTANTTAQTITKTASIVNIQQAFVTCAGLASRTRRVIPPSFKTYPLGTTSRNPVWVDLAGDGAGAMVGFTDFFDPDQLLVERSNSDGTPRGAFAAYPAGTGVSGIVVADFNGDGKQDVAVVYTGSSPTSSTAGGVAILLGNGDGTLKPAVKYPTTANAWTMTAFDFNGDGKPDLAVGDYEGNVQILLANADGTMRTGAKYSMPSAEYNITSIAAADLNGDHIPDLLVQTTTATHILYGKGDGTFGTGPVFASATQPASVGAGDFNLDGITDFAVAGGAGVFIYMGTGSGNFAPPVGYATVYNAFGSGPTTFFVEDFDGDGYPDLVFGAGHPDGLTPVHDDSTIAVLFGNGDGTFASGTTAVVATDASYQQTPTPTNLVAADFNGDGKPDIATSNTSAKSVSVTLGLGGGAFKSPATISLGSVSPTSIAAGAFSSDGKPDIVVTDGVSNVYLLYHNGDGTFQQPIKYPTGGTNPTFVVTGDFNGDKKLDVAVANAGSNNISILPGFGDGSFNSPITIAVGPNPVAMVAGDFNGDGKLDLAVANAGSFSAAGTNLGSVSVLLGKGDGTFQAAVTYPAYQYPTFLTAADVNGDGKLDLIVASKGANGTDEIVVLAGTGSGTFQNGVMSSTTAGPVWISAADFNGDGKVDLVVSHCCQSGTQASMQGNGDGTFQTEVSLGRGSFFSSAAVDFTGDGKPDLAFTNDAGKVRIVTVVKNISVSQGTLTITSAAGNPLKLPPVAAYSITTAKGSDLANDTQVNTAANPPTTLAGTTTAVQDSAGVSRPAQLFYASPVQVNFLIPQATALGTATVTITSGDGHVSAGTVAVTAIAPGIFTLNSNSLVAAYVQRVHADLTQSIEYLYAIDAAGNVTFPAIDLGPATDQVYLNIFGTGLQGRSSLSNVTITVGGVSTPALYAGPSTYPGEDQVAILLPRSLVGAGTVNISLSADGNAANITTLSIK
jgi:uncharacterized protein (TIGR03437 family)